MQRVKIAAALRVAGFTVVDQHGPAYSTKDEAGFLSSHAAAGQNPNVPARHVRPWQEEDALRPVPEGVQRFMANINPILLRLLRQSSVTQVHDVFFWLVCQGNEEMARAMWAKRSCWCTCLAGAAIATSKAGVLVEPAKTSALELRHRRRGPTVSRTWRTRRTRPRYRAEVSRSSGRTPAWTWQCNRRRCSDAASLRQAMDRHWRGGIPGSSITISRSSTTALTLYAALPPLNPYLWKMTKREQRKPPRMPPAATRSSTRSGWSSGC